MEEFESCCKLTITQKKRARCLVRVIDDSKADRQKRQKCREEVKLLVGNEVYEDAKQKLRRMQTDLADSTTEEQKKKRLSKKQIIVSDEDSNTIQVESAADNDPDPVEITAVNHVTVDTVARTVSDAAGVIHNVFPRRIFEANEALKPEKSKKKLCPCCGYPSGCCNLKCMNKECSYVYKKQIIVSDEDSNTIQVESAADNDPDPVENIAVNPVTADTAARTVSDAAGVIHHLFPRRIFEVNEALKPENSRKRLCPCCGYPSGCCRNKCMNKECSYMYKMQKRSSSITRFPS